MGVRSATASACSPSALLAGGDLSALGPQGLAEFISHLFSRIVTHAKNRVLGKPYAAAPTTPSAQATGATGATTLNVNLPEFSVIVDGVEKHFAAEADRSIHATTVYTGVDDSTLTNGKAAIVSIVAKNDGGTISLVDVKGGTATAGAEVAPTSAQIDTAVSSVPWVEVVRVRVWSKVTARLSSPSRSTCQPAPGVNVDADFWGLTP